LFKLLPLHSHSNEESKSNKTPGKMTLNHGITGCLILWLVLVGCSGSMRSSGHYPEAVFARQAPQPDPSFPDQPLEAQVVDEFVELSWDTQNEKTTVLFEVQKSTDALSFQTIARVPPFGASAGAHYVHPDTGLVYNQPIYYRLKIIEKGGQAHYSETVRVYEEKAVTDIDWALNPENNHCFLKFIGAISAVARINLYRSDGALILTEKIPVQSGMNVWEIPLRQHPGGVYFLQFRTPGTHRVLRVLNI